jgi:hypothetical protein
MTPRGGAGPRNTLRACDLRTRGRRVEPPGTQPGLAPSRGSVMAHREDHDRRTKLVRALLNRRRRCGWE